MENGITTEQMIKDILSGAQDAMKANLLEELKKNITNHLSWNLREEMNQITSDFIKEEMTEDIKKLLEESKPVILESLKESFIKIGALVAQAMYETASKNLAVNSYHTADILKKILQ
jgi:hypothetical protein